MSHEVETMFYKGEKPWHGLGLEIPADKRLSIDEALVAAGLNWEVGKLPLMVTSAESWEFQGQKFTVPVHLRSKPVVAYSTYRMSDGTILGHHVGERYVPMQNKDALEWFRPFLDSGEAELHTAGSLQEGRTVWVLAKLNRDPLVIVKGDEVEKFLLLSHAHDGTKAIKVGFTPQRVVCWNTLQMAEHSAASKLIRVKHSRGAQAALEGIRETVDLWNDRFEATAAQYRFLASKGVNPKDLERYVTIVLTKKEDQNEEEEDEPSTKMQNIIQAVFARFEDGLGSEIRGVRGTWWGAYNAFTEYLTYERGHNSSNRLRELWYGTGAKMNERALELALQMAN